MTTSTTFLNNYYNHHKHKEEILKAVEEAERDGLTALHNRFPKVTGLGVWLNVTRRKNGVTGKARLFYFNR